MSFFGTEPIPVPRGTQPGPDNVRLSIGTEPLPPIRGTQPGGTAPNDL